MTLTLTRTDDDYARIARQTIAPGPSQGIWDWCRQYLRMANGTHWQARRALLVRRAYRIAQARLSGCVDPADPHAHQVEQLWLVLGSQIAKSVLLYAIALWSMRWYPRKMALYMKRKDDLTAVRRTRLEKMLLKTPDLEALLPRGVQARREALANLVWQVGLSELIYLCGAVSDDWRMHDLPLMLLDEFDKYPDNCEGEGDPIDLGLVRQRTYRQIRLAVGTSTPGIVAGHAWRRLCSGSHERPLIVCPGCTGADWLNPAQICLTGTNGGKAGKLNDAPPQDIIARHLARWACRWCGSMHDSDAIHRAIRRCAAADTWAPGTWSISPENPQGAWHPDSGWLHPDTGRLVATPPPITTRIRSLWASSLYSIDVTLDGFAAQMAATEQGTAEMQRTFANTERAEPSIISQTIADEHTLLKAVPAEPSYHHGSLPIDCDYIALFFDQQENQWDKAWFPYTVRGVNRGGESWLIQAGVARNHAERDLIEATAWQVGSTSRQADVIWMDVANGNVRFDLYLWAARDSARRRLLRGDPKLDPGIPWKEVVDDERQRRARRTPRPAGVKEYRVHPYYWRNELWDRMLGKGKAAWWRPSDAPQFYLNSMTSEEQKVERRKVTGHGYKDILVWKPRLVSSTSGRETYRDDNHWWDTEADQLAGIDIMGWNDPPPPPPPEEPLIAVGFT